MLFTQLRELGRRAKPLTAKAVWSSLLMGFVTLLLFACVFVFPSNIVTRALSPAALRQLTPADRLKAENDVRSTLLQGLAGLVLLGGAITTWRQLQVGRDQLEINRQQLQTNLQTSLEQLDLAREGQIAERFTRAIEQLGNLNLDVRLGGIYALGQIHNTAAEYRSQIVEVLTAYLRCHFPWPPKDDPGGAEVLPLQVRVPDAQAVMNVLGQRSVIEGETVEIPMEFHFSGSEVNAEYRASTIELTSVDLRRAYLFKANLIGANLANSNLERADFFEAHLRAANFTNAILKGARFDGADVEGTVFAGAHLQDTDFSSAVHLDRALLTGAVKDLKTRWPEGFRPPD